MWSVAIVFITLQGCGNRESGSAISSRDTTSSSGDTAARKNILIFGNSLTAGLGVEPEESFPSVLQSKIDSAGLPYNVVNAGLSGETSAAGKARIAWVLKQPVDIFVLELGANDGLRGIAVSETVKNLQNIIDQVKAKYPGAKLLMTGMEVPPNMGGAYASEFRVIFRELAQKNNMALVPFLLENVGGVSELNQRDGIHPTAEGHQILAENVWVELRKML